MGIRVTDGRAPAGTLSKALRTRRGGGLLLLCGGPTLTDANRAPQRPLNQWLFCRELLGASLAVSSVVAFGLGVGLGHVFAHLALSIVLCTFAMVDLGLRVDPDFSVSAAGSSRGSSSGLSRHCGRLGSRCHRSWCRCGYYRCAGFRGWCGHRSRRLRKTCHGTEKAKTQG